MRNFTELFADFDRAGVYRLPKMMPGDLESLIVGANAAGCLVQRVDLLQARNKDDLLAMTGRALGFPEWFGLNWDALNDCLLDMGWRPAVGYVTVLDHCDAANARAPADFALLMQAFRDAADEWRGQQIPFWCLVDLQSTDLAAL